MSENSDARQAYVEACVQARARSLQPDYKGCAVHLCAVITRKLGYPQITGYTLSDWYDDSVVDTYVNGHQRDR
jgi:hypothetical protein